MEMPAYLFFFDSMRVENKCICHGSVLDGLELVVSPLHSSVGDLMSRRRWVEESVVVAALVHLLTMTYGNLYPTCDFLAYFGVCKSFDCTSARPGSFHAHWIVRYAVSFYKVQTITV